MKLVVLPPVWDDLEAGFNFYKKRSEVAAHNFRASLIREIDELQQAAGFHRKSAGFHKVLSRRFPYAIYYAMSGEAVVVFAVIDQRRNPAWIWKRLSR